ncbi:MAG: hypothetical protein Q9171_002188 [Xanthocarpia ochracea]
MMDDNQPPVPQQCQKQDEGSDWEYEYDETETEVKSATNIQSPSIKYLQSFYVTVDVSSASQQVRAPRKFDPISPTDSNPQGQNGQDQPGTTLPIDPALKGTASTNQTTGNAHDRIQILDLHTQNPLISYHDRIYSCTWASTIGTDIFLASPESLSAASIDREPVTPIYTLPNVSIIGTSCINLTARPVTITPRNDTSQPQPTTPAPSTYPQPVPIAPNDDPSQTVKPTSAPPAFTLPNPDQPLKIPLSPAAANTRRAQASFLESLSAIKASKGETDQVTVHATKQNQGTGWRVQRRLAQEQAALLNEHDNEDEDDDDVEPMDLAHADLPSQRLADAPANVGAAEHNENQEDDTRPSPSKRGRYGPRGSSGTRKIGRPKGSYRRKALKAGGLFRDYVPDAGDSVGADIRGVGGEGTPKRWEEVERGLLPVEDGDVGVGGSHVTMEDVR